MNTLQRKQLTLLNDTIKYYSEDVNRRCMSGGRCFYDPASVSKQSISEGCAVGRLLSPRLKKKLDKQYSLQEKESAVIDIWQHLPKKVQEYGQDFLTALQQLHDISYYWNETGLSERGLTKARSIKERFVLVD